MELNPISIDQQPYGDSAKNFGRTLPDCPPGLEYLTQLDQLQIQQKVELFEVFTNIETKNRFVVLNKTGQQCYFAYEESELCMRLCCGKGRGFTMHIVDNLGQEVIRIVRPFKCCAGCCWCADKECCSFNVIVESPPGNVIGSIRQSRSFWIPCYEILDEANQVVFRVKGPCCILQGALCTCDFPFKVIPVAGVSSDSIGQVTKKYSGLGKECFTDATHFNVDFPVDLNVKMKACIFAMTFLIDIMFFENNNNS